MGYIEQVSVLLEAPCVFCGYRGANYWQRGTHPEGCPWHLVDGGIEARRERLGTIVRALYRAHALRAKVESLAANGPGSPVDRNSADAQLAKAAASLPAVARVCWHYKTGRPCAFLPHEVPAKEHEYTHSELVVSRGEALAIIADLHRQLEATRQHPGSADPLAQSSAEVETKSG